MTVHRHFYPNLTGLSNVALRDGRKVVLRSLRETDLPELTKFANRIVDDKTKDRELGIVSLDERVTREGEREFLERTLAGIQSGDVVSVAAFDGKKMVGNCDVVRRKPRDVRHTGLLGIVIQAGYRGQGLGELMVRAALDESLKLGMSLVELAVFATNGRARDLYRRLGFVEAGVVPGKILRDGRPIDEVLMYADLKRSDKSTPRERGKR